MEGTAHRRDAGATATATVQGEDLAACAYFRLQRYRLQGPWTMPFAGRLSIWIVLEGAAELVAAEGDYRRSLNRGQTILVLAAAPPLKWQPAAAGLPGSAACGGGVTGEKRRESGVRRRE